MTGQEKIEILQQQLRELEQENTALRNPPKPPPATTARHEVEALIFQVRALKAKVAACEALLREYQSQMRKAVGEFHASRPRKP